MLQIELKKILFHQKGILIILLSLAAYAFVTLCSGYDSSYALDRNGEAYNAYLERWQGAITPEKAQEMEAEYNAVNHSDNGNKSAFMVIYNQYYYAKEDAAHRCIMDERGWNTLLTHDGLNFILILCLLAISVPVFCGEYQCGMDQVLRSCRNGRKRLALVKLFTLLSLAICITALFQLAQLFALSSLTSLDGASYPLQSLPFFEKSPYWVTIGQAYGLVFLLRCIGAAWFVILIAFLSTLFRKVVLTAFAGITFSALPHLIGNGFIKYVLPIPAGMLAGNGYIWGRLTASGYDESWNLIDVTTFQGIAPAELVILLIAVFIVMGVTFCATIRQYVGRQNQCTPRFTTALTVLLFATTLLGCSQTQATELSHDFLADAMQGENASYTVTLDMVENNIYATDKTSGETILLTCEPFAKEKMISSIFVDEQACYYSAQGYAGTGFDIYRIDLKDLSQQLYFSSSSYNSADFWGLYKQGITEDEVLADSDAISSFIVTDGQIYYLQDNQLRHICCLTGHETVIVSDVHKQKQVIYKDGHILK